MSRKATAAKESLDVGISQDRMLIRRHFIMSCPNSPDFRSYQRWTSAFHLHLQQRPDTLFNVESKCLWFQELIALDLFFADLVREGQHNSTIPASEMEASAQVDDHRHIP